MLEKMKLKKEIKRLNKQIDAGDVQAMYDLAMIYLDGSIIKKDETKAYSLLQKAANLGHIQSKTYLVSKKITDGIAVGAKAFSDIQSIFKS